MAAHGLCLMIDKWSSCAWIACTGTQDCGGLRAQENPGPLPALPLPALQCSASASRWSQNLLRRWERLAHAPFRIFGSCRWQLLCLSQVHILHSRLGLASAFPLQQNRACAQRLPLQALLVSASGCSELVGAQRALCVGAPAVTQWGCARRS